MQKLRELWNKCLHSNILQDLNMREQYYYDCPWQFDTSTIVTIRKWNKNIVFINLESCMVFTSTSKTTLKWSMSRFQFTKSQQSIFVYDTEVKQQQLVVAWSENTYW